MITNLTVNELNKVMRDDFLPNLLDLYETAAHKLNITLKKGEVYDCSKIYISENIYKFFAKKAQEQDDRDGMVNLNMLLLFAGPKVSEDLKDYEIEFDKNAIKKGE